jgi:uncharacterized membrane protein YhaH (DUF805 family)
VTAVAALPVRSCLIDGEAIVSDEAGLAVYELLRSFRHNHAAVLCAFDLLELDGEDLRRLPIGVRKAGLAGLLHTRHSGIALIGHGDIVYQQACKLGCEAVGLAVSLRPIEAMAQGQESSGASGAARGRGGLGTLTPSRDTASARRYDRRAMSRGFLMGFDDAIKLGFANYVNFSGRACRSEYWYWALFYTVGMLATGLIDRWIVGPPFILDGIFWLATLLLGVSVSVRRLHDLDRSGWWILLDLVPLVGWIVLLIWFCTKGTDGPNRFGADRVASLGQIRPRPA